MPGRDQDWNRNAEYEAYDRNRRELGRREGRTEDRSFWSDEDRRGSDDPRRLGDYEGRTGEGRAWRDERSGSRYDQDRASYGRSNRPEWQDRDWQGGSPGLSRGDDRRSYEEGRSRSFRQGRADEFGYGGQEFGIEAGRGRDFGRSPEPVQRVTDGDEDRNWRDRFGDDGRTPPRFSDEDRRDRDEPHRRGLFGGRDDDDRRFGREEDHHRPGLFGGRDDGDRRGLFGRDRHEDRERRLDHGDDQGGRMRWRDEGGPYGDTRVSQDRGMSDYGVPHDYGVHQSFDPFEAESSRRRQEDIRRRREEDDRRRADIQRREDEWRASQSRTPWDRDRY